MFLAVNMIKYQKSIVDLLPEPAVLEWLRVPNCSYEFLLFTIEAINDRLSLGNNKNEDVKL